MATATTAPAAAAALPLLLEFLGVQEERARLYAGFRETFRAYLAARDEGAYKRAVRQLTGEFSACSQQVRALEARLASPVQEGGVGRPDLSALLRAVQDAEADKLRLTVSWQALRDAATPQAIASAGSGAQGAAALTQQLQQTAVEAAAGAATAQCGHGSSGHHHSHGEGLSGSCEAGANGLDTSSHRASDQNGHGPSASCCDLGDVGHGAGGGVARTALEGAFCYGDDGLAAPLAAEVAAAAADAVRGLEDAISAINGALEEVREAVEELRGEAAAGEGAL